MNTPYVTIDTDNAVIRFYATRALADGLTEAAVSQLRRDLETLAVGVSHACSAQFRVVLAA